MKIRFIAVALVVFVFAPMLFGQTKRTAALETSLKINEAKWIKDAQLTANLTVKNNSDGKVKVYLPPHFILEKKEINDSPVVFGDQYSSKEKNEDHIITKRTERGTSYNIRQFFKFSLKSGESKTVEFDLTNLGWNDRMSSILIDKSWYGAIPNGSYNLYYLWGWGLGKGGKARGIELDSNRVEVELNYEK